MDDFGAPPFWKTSISPYIYMYVCRYVCMYVCLYVCMYIYNYVCIYIIIDSICVFIYMYARIGSWNHLQGSLHLGENDTSGPRVCNFFGLFGGWVCFRFVKNYIQPDPFVPLALSNSQSESSLFGMVILYRKNSLGFLGGQNGSSYQWNLIYHMTGGINIHNPVISPSTIGP